MEQSQLADITEIEQLLARYAVTITQEDIDGLVAVFTPDGTYSAFGETYSLDRFPVLVDAAPKGLFMTATPVIDLDGDTATNYDRMRGKVVDELKKHFKPEFLNRVDETIVFPQLNQEELLQIVDLFITRLKQRLMDRDLTIELTLAAKERLIKIGFDPTLGARPLRRAVQHEVEDRLSEKILHGELNAGDHVHVDFLEDEFVLTTTRQPGLTEAEPIAVEA